MHRTKEISHPVRRAVLTILLWLRGTALRRPIIDLLVRLHNFSYHMIALFASYTGTHPKHRILNYHQFFVDHVSPSDRVLDVGCGQGDVANDVARKAQRVLGIDVSDRNIRIARNRYHRNNLQFICADATTYAFDQRYDVIVLSNVLEHIDDRVGFLRKLETIAPKILIRVPLITRDWISVYKKDEGFEYRLDATHTIEYDEETFHQEVNQAGLVIDSSYVRFGELYAVTYIAAGGTAGQPTTPRSTKHPVPLRPQGWEGTRSGRARAH